MSRQKIQGSVIVSDTDPLVREHRLDGIHILPGVAMLDALYKTLEAAGYRSAGFVLNDLLFHEPVVTHEGMDRHLTVTIELAEPAGQVNIHSRPGKGGGVLSEDRTLHLSGRIRRAELRWPVLESSDMRQTMDLDACYGVTRKVGIHHDDFMKCRGQVQALPDGGCMARVSLGERARQRQSDFLLHPVFLDCSTVVPLFRWHDRLDEANLFIPFGIEEFQATSLTGHQDVVIVVDPNEAADLDREVLKNSFSLFSTEGEPLVRFRNFTVKRVRSLDNVRRLLTSGISARHRSASSPELQPEPQPEGRSEQHDHGGLTEQIVRLIAQHTQVRLDPDRDGATSFFELGLDSMALLDLCDALGRELGIDLYPTLLFEHASLNALSAYLAETGAGSVSVPKAMDKTEPVPANKNTGLESADGGAPTAYLPRWRPISPKNEANTGNLDASVALLGITRDQPQWEALKTRVGAALCLTIEAATPGPALEQLQAALDESATFDQLWCLGLGHEALFQTLQMLIKSSRLQHPLQLVVLSRRAFSLHGEAVDRDAAHGVWGLLQTASREYPALRVTQIDLPNRQPLDDAHWGWISQQVTTQADRQLLALRDGRCYRRNLFPARHEGLAPQSWRNNGAYLIVGGSGGVGLALAERLCSRFDAQVAVMGRRSAAEVPEFQALASRFGSRLLYLQGRVDEEADLTRALAETRRQFGRLDGVIHAAMVLDDKHLAEMSEADFHKVLVPKVAGIQVLSKVVEPLALDFLLVFSSLQSFVGNISQGNYAAASTFVDGYASALRQSCSFPVMVVNWGVWGEVGAVAGEAQQALLARQGMIGMTTDNALDALDRTLAAGWSQAVIADVQPEVLEALGVDREFEVVTRTADKPAAQPDPFRIDWTSERLAPVLSEFRSTGDAMDQLTSLALKRLIALFRDDLGLTKVEQVEQRPDLLKDYQRQVTTLFSLLPEDLTKAESLTAEAFGTAVAEWSQRHPTLTPFTGLLVDCLAAYPDILTGKVRAPDVIFPKGRIDAVKAVYADNRVSGFYNDLLAERVVDIAASLDRPVRILEIGAGTGATTQAVVERLGQAGLAYQYAYTELWDTLLADAKARLGKVYPDLSFHCLDANSDPFQQGFTEPFDIVIATNVLHATRHLATSLQHVKRLLEPGGRLLLNESVAFQAYSTLTFGLLPGWWQTQDAEERLPNSPLVSRQGWHILLREAGFSTVQGCISPGCDEVALHAQEVFVAVSNGEARVKRSPKRDPSQSAAPSARQAEPSETPPAALLAGMQPVDWAELGLSPEIPQTGLRLYRDHRRHLWLFLDNPPANTFTDECLGALCRVLEALHYRPDVLGGQLLYLSHTGPYFSLGGDRLQIARWVSEHRTDALRGFADKARRLLVALSNLEALVIAVVNGSAQGGGLETLLATDLQVVRSGVGLGLPEIKSGLVPGMGGMTYLQQQIGMAPLKRLLLCGGQISAQQAHALGLISHLADDPFEAAMVLGDQLDHLETAVLMKQRLNRNATDTLTADIDYWLDYVLRHGRLIDLKRIEDSAQVVAKRVAQTPDLTY